MAEDEFSQALPNKHDFFYHHHQEPSAELEFENQLAFNMNNHLMQDPNHDHLSLSNWSGPHHDQMAPQDHMNHHHHQSFSSSADMYHPLFHLNLPPPQPPLFQSIPHDYSLPASRSINWSLFGDDNTGLTYQDGDAFEEEDGGVFEYTRNIGRGSGGAAKITTTERERRQHLNGKFTVLRNLIPNPTKNDRASVVGDAIEYIKELITTVNELRLLVDKKRERNMKPLAAGHPDSYNGSFKRKSKDAEVDVRIVDDEVTIKLIQRKKIDCLLFVSNVLDQLQLDLHHVAGGRIGDCCSFLFNTKICEGSSVYAGSNIANKLIDVMDKQYAAVPAPTSGSTY